LGNLRTAVVAYLAARQCGLAFHLRIEDLDDRSRPQIADRQLADLERLGLSWDGPVVYQSSRRAIYDAAIDKLAAQGLVYQCYCSRREVAASVRAPHRPPGAYPGTCRDPAERDKRRLEGRKPALRLRADPPDWPVVDRLGGSSRQSVDDFILRRSDGVASYNLAVVVDDAAQAVRQVTRAQDLLSSSGRQSYLGHLLGFEPVEYVHIGLVMNSQGQRLAKRDRALAGEALWRSYGGAQGLLGAIGHSLGLMARGCAATMGELAYRFDLARAYTGPWVV
jgi:glutamyl-tRNA synthetase